MGRETKQAGQLKQIPDSKEIGSLTTWISLTGSDALLRHALVQRQPQVRVEPKTLEVPLNPAAARFIVIRRNITTIITSSNTSAFLRQHHGSN